MRASVVPLTPSRKSYRRAAFPTPPYQARPELLQEILQGLHKGAVLADANRNGALDLGDRVVYPFGIISEAQLIAELDEAREPGAQRHATLTTMSSRLLPNETLSLGMHVRP